MRQRRGDFYIYQQHDDLLSPTYIADLVEASARWPNAVICFSKLQFTGQRDWEISSPSLLGDPRTRALNLLRRLDWVPFRGLIRGSALDKTSGLLLSDFDPFDSLGTEHRFMAELSLLGEFRFVEGPIYFKSWHGQNLSIKREGWSMDHWITANACFAAWMIEVIAPAGGSVQERRRFFEIAVERFAGRTWIRSMVKHSKALMKDSKALILLRMIRDGLKRSEKLTAAVQALNPSPVGPDISSAERAALLRQVYERLKNGGRFDPRACMNMTWEALGAKYFGITKGDRS
jgi:hypothetical protein